MPAVYYTAAFRSCQKEFTSPSLLEPLILYFVLFFPDFANTPANGNAVIADSIPFYPLRELSRTVVYTVPALALIWYMVLHKKSISGKIVLKPSLTDLRQFLLGFPALVLTGVVLSFLMTRFSVLLPPKVEAPGSAFAWVVMAVSCAGTGYLEESFFRFYLLKKTEEWSSGRLARIIFSVVLFAVCHFYEGPWGILNAVIAGVILALLFERHKTLHGIAWAHGAYNAFVYVMGIFA